MIGMGILVLVAVVGVGSDEGRGVEGHACTNTAGVAPRGSLAADSALVDALSVGLSRKTGAGVEPGRPSSEPAPEPVYLDQDAILPRPDSGYLDQFGGRDWEHEA